jgi:hypothetical protein
MRHLTADEIITLADRKLANGTSIKAEQHANACTRCRREVEFQRTICAVANRSVSSYVSPDFNSRLFAKIGLTLPERKSSLLSGLLGNAFAFMMVVGLFGIIVTQLGATKASDVPTGQTTIEKLSDGWGKLAVVLSSEVKRLPFVSKLSEGQNEAKVLASIGLALILLLLLDFFLSKQSIRLKSQKHS